MPKVIVTVGHRLGQAEARSRIEKLLHRVHDLGGVWKGHWTSDTCLHFTGRVQGQSVTGEVQAEHRAVKLMVVLPSTLAWFSGCIKAVLEKSAQEVLLKP